MKMIHMARVLAALMVAGGDGSSDVPGAPRPQGPSIVQQAPMLAAIPGAARRLAVPDDDRLLDSYQHTGRSFATTPVAGVKSVRSRLLSSSLATPLSVSMYCSKNYELEGIYECYANASGGTGTGYTFQWWNAWEDYEDEEGWSSATVDCYSYGYGYVSVYVTVTDSGNATHSVSTTFWCVA